MGVAVCAVPAASTRGSGNPMDKRAELWPDTMHACQGVSNEAVCAVPVASTGGSTVPMDKRAESRPDTLHNDPAAKAKGSDKHARMRPDVRGTYAVPVASTNPMTERAQQRVEHPRHWLKVPANNPMCEEEVSKRRALATKLMGEAAHKPVKIRGLMCPRLRALEHPAASLLKEYASQGCPVDVGRNWTAKELKSAVEKGPHSSLLEPDAIEQIQIEAREK